MWKLLLKMGNKTSAPPLPPTTPTQNPAPNIGFLCDWDAKDPAHPKIIGMKNVRRNLEASFYLPRKFPDFCTGIEPIRSMLMWGPPGTGKTLVVNRFATAIGYKFVSVIPSQIYQKYVGQTETIITEIFNQAMTTNTVLFLDEIDSYAKQRKSEEQQWVTSMKTTLMLKLQEFLDRKETESLVVACTNTVSDLDDAVRRRFSTTIYVDLPDQQDREELLRSLLRGVKHTLSEQDITSLAVRMKRFSGSDISLVVKKVAAAPLTEILGVNHFFKNSENKWEPCLPAHEGAKRMLLTEIPHNSLMGRRSITLADFDTALHSVQPTVSEQVYRRFREEVEKIGGADMNMRIEQVDREV
jgi:SpoVK/Ycf46/Vps4 family AAA+-type ATPase